MDSQGRDWSSRSVNFSFCLGKVALMHCMGAIIAMRQGSGEWA